MKVIDCNKCANCDKENDRCKLYGSDPKKAVEMCASKNFGGYRPNCGAKIEAKKRSSPVAHFAVAFCCTQRILNRIPLIAVAVRNSR